LKNFEIAVVFALKRKEQKQSLDLEDFILKNTQQQYLLKTLNEEMKKISSSNKHFKVQLENLSQKLNKLELNTKSNKDMQINKRCIII
jgi:dsDNA-specific endonuclease/ATPase MutS2